MPTYEYVCKECEHRFEKRQSFSEKALRTCPNCGKKELRKVLFPTGVVFKGSGFYVTDSKSQAKSSTSSSGESSGESDKSGGSDKSGSSDKSGGGSTSKESTKASKDG